VLRILSLNAWGDHGPPQRQPVLQKAIETLAPDILCLQETPLKLLSRLKIPVRASAPETGLSISSRLPLLGKQLLQYTTRSPLESCQRQALLVQVKTDQGPLGVATTHLAWKAEDGASRLGQVEELLNWIPHPEEPVVLTGDFNAEPHSAPIRKLIKAGFLDGLAAKEPALEAVTWDNNNPFIQSHSTQFPNRRVDYLFLRQPNPPLIQLDDTAVVCSQANSQGLYPSDHYGVAGTLTFIRQ
jgi:endonuclease/exonuclease/phosphatase family metal-dependent hydrolase